MPNFKALDFMHQAHPSQSLKAIIRKLWWINFLLVSRQRIFLL